jgi:tRNA 2-thiouridine synthesizing protein A
MADIIVDVKGQTCPVPLVETRKALKRATAGDTVSITGDNPASRKEIPMAAEALGVQVLSNEQQGDGWTIRLQK